ncbi:hypothetical protein [uncultured Mediterranean phage]|jgi:hypothetical protein|nr:hypothetical protein [uncultured Mediterranean phage]
MAFQRRGYVPGQPTPGMMPASQGGDQSQRRSPSFGEPNQSPFGRSTRRKPAGPPPDMGGSFDGRQAGPPSRSVSPMVPAVRPDAPVPSPDPIAPVEAAVPMEMGGEALGGNPMDMGVGGVDIEQMLAEFASPQNPAAAKRRV